jgi:hypothetical protein
MVTVKISPAGRASGLTRIFPLELEVPDDATVAVIKKTIAAKHPKVCLYIPSLQRVIQAHSLP